MTVQPTHPFIAGEWAGEGTSDDGLNPTTLQTLGKFYPKGTVLVDAAAAAERDAFFLGKWASAPRVRAMALMKIAGRIETAEDEIADGINSAFRAVRVGAGDRPDSQLATLVDLENRGCTDELIGQAGDEDGIILKGEPLGDATFLRWILFRIDDVSLSLVQDELGGPIVSVETFEDEAEAVANANATAFGLAASALTRDHHRAMPMARAIRSGTVRLNSHLRLFAEAETGGYGKSGRGCLHGPEGLHDFLETKHIYTELGCVAGSS